MADTPTSLYSSPESTFSFDAAAEYSNNINDQLQQHDAVVNPSGLAHLDTDAVGSALLPQPSAYRSNSYTSDSDFEQKETFDTLGHLHLGDDGDSYSPRAELRAEGEGGSDSSELFPSGEEEENAYGVDDSQSQHPPATLARVIHSVPAVVVQTALEGVPVALRGAQVPQPRRGTDEYRVMDKVRKQLSRERLREQKEIDLQLSRKRLREEEESDLQLFVDHTASRIEERVSRLLIKVKAKEYNGVRGASKRARLAKSHSVEREGGLEDEERSSQEEEENA